MFIKPKIKIYRYQIFINGLFSYDTLYSCYLYLSFFAKIFRIPSIIFLKRSLVSGLENSCFLVRKFVFLEKLQNLLLVVKSLTYKKCFQNDSQKWKWNIYFWMKGIFIFCVKNPALRTLG